tara:strand:- start:61 stop:354 length:294 start_codon:yes stop_codon:yes gene_type:complete
LQAFYKARLSWDKVFCRELTCHSHKPIFLLFLELKIEGVKHGKEIAFTGTDYQEIKDAIDGNDPPFTLCDGAPCICRKQEEVASEDLAIFVALHDVG